VFVNIQQPVRQPETFSQLHTCYCSDNSSTDLQITINNLVVWAAKWQMEIAYSKCSLITFGNCPYDAGLSYHIDSFVLPSVSSVSDLGVVMDSSLKFSQHYLSRCALRRSALFVP